MAFSVKTFARLLEFVYLFNLVSSYIHPPAMKKGIGSVTLTISNYFDLLPEMPRYCFPIKTFYFDFQSFKEIRLKFRTFCQDRQAREMWRKIFFPRTQQNGASRF